jgi:putative ABC transport system permease protein
MKDIVRMALASLRSNKLRSSLTMLGIVIGIASVIAVTAMGRGAQQAVEDRIARLGSTLIQVNPRRVRTLGVSSESNAKLTDEDARFIRARAPHVLAVQFQQDRNLPVTFEDRNTRSRVVGTSPNFLTVRNYQLAYGGMFTEADDARFRRVAVLGASVVEQLGIVIPERLIGRTIRLGGAQFEVIGVLAAKGRTSPFGDPDLQVLIPYRTGRFVVFGHDRLNDIYAIATSDDDVDRAMAEITLALRRTHRLRAGWPDDFRVRHQAAFLETMGSTTRVFGTLLAGVAAVSLLVGGIGIMNIMLVSVTERTREIGIRKALGATRRSILLQFLSEALALCLAGGIVGIATGAGAALLLREVFGWKTDVAPVSIVVAFAFAAMIGLVFGVWPAKRAAAQDPIAALRYE